MFSALGLIIGVAGNVRYQPFPSATDLIQFMQIQISHRYLYVEHYNVGRI